MLALALLLLRKLNKVWLLKIKKHSSQAVLHKNIVFTRSEDTKYVFL